MIIVKTKNGDRFINDKAVTMVEHDREKTVANAYGDKGVFFRIEDVEGVVYTNDAQPTSWKDEGSEIQRLKKELDEEKEWGGRMHDAYLKMEQERDDLKARVAQLEPKPAADYENDKLRDKVYYEIDRLDVQEREEYKKKYPGLGAYQKRGNAVRFMNVAKEHDIETVGQLLEVGRARFEQFRNMGRLCADRISEALDNLYGIKGW
jgi:hypothetical protein